MKNSIDELCSGEGNYCCPICLTWYKTHEEKSTCLQVNHGYEVLNVSCNLTPEEIEKDAY